MPGPLRREAEDCRVVQATDGNRALPAAAAEPSDKLHNTMDGSG